MKWSLITICVGLVLIWLAWIPLIFWSNPHDDTDPAGGGYSGMLLYTDHLTGCQYLGRPIFGGLTPRLGINNKIICRTGDVRG